MYHKKSIGEHIFDLINICFMIVLVIVTLYPFWFVTVASFSSPLSVASNRGLMLTIEGFNIDSYRAVFKNPNIWIGYKNTLIYLVLGTFINMLMTTIGAYGLSRKNLYGRRLIMAFITFTMFFSGGMIPGFLVVKNLGMVDTIWSMVIPGAIGTYFMIIMRTSFEGIPVDFEEAARIDGANDFTIMWKVIIPLSLPTIAVISLFYAVRHWNAYFNALLFLRSRELFPLQIILREILVTNSMNDMLTDISVDRQPISETIKYATIIVSTLPILLLYPYLQKYFIKGVLIGGLKG